MRFLMIMGVLALCGCSGTTAPPSASDGAIPLSASAPASRAVDQLLNSARQNAGLPAVQSAEVVDRVAQAHARDMVANGYFSHVSPGGEGLGGRLSRAGLRSCTAAENIAAGQTTAQAAFASWMASAPHRANILNRSVTAYGIGQAGDHWVLVLVRPC